MIICFVIVVLIGNVGSVYAGNVLYIPEKQLDFRVNERHQQSKTMQIYGLSDNTGINISSSKLSSKDSNDFIESNKMKFNDASKFNTTLNDGDVKEIVVSVIPDKPGIFTGDIIVHNTKNNTVQSIPVNLLVTPLWPLYILVFLV